MHRVWSAHNKLKSDKNSRLLQQKIEKEAKIAADDTPFIPSPPQPNKISNMRIWKSAVDPRSGKTYYYDAITRETTWVKPSELVLPNGRADSAASKKKALRGFFNEMERNILLSLAKGIIPGTASSKNKIDEEEDRDKVGELLKKPCAMPSVVSKSILKPRMFRTISKMDDTVLMKKTLVTGTNVRSRNATNERIVENFDTSIPPPPEYGPSPSSSEGSINEPQVSIETILRCSLYDDSKCGSRVSPVNKPILHKRNTCGTMYVKSTMSRPDKDTTITALCGVFRDHLLQSVLHQQHQFPEYKVFNDCCTGKNEIPSLEDVINFYRGVFVKSQMECECLIVSLVYVERLIKQTNGNLRPNVSNWRSILFSCMIMSSKVWDDLSMWNGDFSQVVIPSASNNGVIFNLARINELEKSMLTCLEYKTKVSSSEYAKYYFLLRSMLLRSGLSGEDIENLKPLDIEGARRLEQCSALYQEQLEQCPARPDNKRPTSLNRRAKTSSEKRAGWELRRTSLNLEQLVQM